MLILEKYQNTNSCQWATFVLSVCKVKPEDCRKFCQFLKEGEEICLSTLQYQYECFYIDIDDYDNEVILNLAKLCIHHSHVALKMNE